MHPELIPGSSILPELEQISAAVTDLKQVYEPLASTYLAKGTVGYEDYRSIPMRLRSRMILATITGTSRNFIRLNFVCENYRSAKQDTTAFQIAMDRYDVDHAVTWAGEQKTTILQILFSTDTGNGSLLAARRHTCVDILKPMVWKSTIHRKQMRSSELGTGEILNNSQLDPNWILRVSLQESEDIMIADFAFNAWSRMECAVLGTSGEFKILEIQDPQRNRHSWTVVTKAESYLRLYDSTAQALDGWGKILWVTGSGSILVAARKLTCIYSLSREGLILETSNSRIVSADHRVLDVKDDGKDSHHVLVLTSTSLIVYACGPITDDEKTEELQHTMDTLVSALHYRDVEDVSLQISVASTKNGMCTSYFRSHTY